MHQKLLSLVKVSFLDINCACPAKKVVKKKAGAYLLRDPHAISNILKKLTSGLNIPITVKMRIGYDEKDINHIVELSKRCADSGAKALFVHGRTRSQGYTGEIDYASIKAIKESVNIPVFGSGNVFTPESAKVMLDEAGCDGVLVARGALGNPWIFRNIESYLETDVMPPPVDIATRCDVLKKHLSLIEGHKDTSALGKTGLMRKTALWYMKGFPRSAQLRGKITAAKNYEQILELLNALT